MLSLGWWGFCPWPPACTGPWITKYPGNVGLGRGDATLPVPGQGDSVRLMSLGLFPYLCFTWAVCPVLGHDREPRRVGNRGGRRAAYFHRGDSLYSDAGAELIPGGWPGNYLKESWLCPSLESKLLRARSHCAQRCWALDSASAFPILDYSYCQAWSLLFAELLPLEQSLSPAGWKSSYAER